MSAPAAKKDRPGDAGGTSPAAGALAFAVFTGVGLLTLAAVVLLPEYASLVNLRMRRDALARQRDCERRLAAYNDRLIRAMETDPVLAARLMMLHGRYRPVGCKAVKVEAAGLPDPVPQQILQDAMTPPRAPDDPLYRAAQWLDHSRTSTSLMILALGAVAVGVILFGSRSRPACSL